MVLEILYPISTENKQKYNKPLIQMESTSKSGVKESQYRIKCSHFRITMLENQSKLQ